MPERDPDVVVLLATALAPHQVLHGSSLGAVVASVGLAAKRVDADGTELLRAAARENRGEEQVKWDHDSNWVSSLAQ